VKIDYRGHGWRRYNQVLGQLDQALKEYLLRRGRACTVEIKGQVGDKEHYGKLARLPVRSDWDETALSEFESTPTHKMSWLLGRLAGVEHRVAALPPAVNNTKVRVGSHTGTTVPSTALAQIPDLVRRFKGESFYLHAYHVQPNRKGRCTRLRPGHMAIALAVLTVIKPHLQRGLETPSKLVRLIWKQAFADGLIDRGWDDSLWSAIWKTLADCQFLHVESTDYWFHSDGLVKGQCMKWALKDEIIARAHPSPATNSNTHVIAGTPPRSRLGDPGFTARLACRTPRRRPGRATRRPNWSEFYASGSDAHAWRRPYR
jgi:hypothetical protein